MKGNKETVSRKWERKEGKIRGERKREKKREGWRGNSMRERRESKEERMEE